MFMEEGFIDLYTLQTQLKLGLEDLFPDRIWLRAEIGSISVKTNGHCYLDLSQDENGMTVAKAKAVIWRSRYALLSSFFTAETGSPLKAGMTVLVRAQVSYSELYGLTLSIDDIDPQFTLGEREKERRETIERLRSEGMLDRQQELVFPPLPYSLAVVSARDAAGLGDFLHHLHDNEFGFVFGTELFEATMQGENAPESIIDALDRIESSGVEYDAVLIMRGGGSVFDLSCFDDYDLCWRIASCRIPVFTAIGHDKDRHVADMVAYDSVKTPTALADMLIDCYMAEDEKLSSYSSRLRLAFSAKVAALSSRVDVLESRIRAADPRGLLSRGYTLALGPDGVVLKSGKSIASGQNIRIMLSDATLHCTVDSVEIKEQ